MSSSLKSHNSKQDHHVILFKKYKVEMVIGEGSYAKVKLATNIINGQKVTKKKKINNNNNINIILIYKYINFYNFYIFI